MDLITVLIMLVVVGVCLYLIESLPMEPTIKLVIRVVVVLVMVLWLLRLFVGPIHIPLR